ncbi:NAT14 isoform 4 [Pan troglodytes]|uniref:N-acetyltransferase 14 (putative) n=3 Tax=Homininae TaxID=207598 RepID=M0R284_HUMAN|nr:NAT14 isoform 4 [Pan troglodytes]
MAPTPVCTEKPPRVMSAKSVLSVPQAGRAIWGGGEEAEQNTPQS